MRPAVIEVANLSVAYRFYSKPVDQIKELVFGGIRHETFWALRDVSLSIAEGERVGVVGPNGAGKSTLLKVIAGTMQATSGRISTHGRISSLLSMVPAWNVEESGIENIRFNLLLNGIAEKRIPNLIEDIAEFTELGPFLFHPVKTYSTGMGARLSFGIATATEPEILIIDEVLGTGDGYFAWKAMKRMEEFCARGRAMILVSHATAAIQSMCDRVVWMQNGSIRLDGSTAEVISAYEQDYRRAEDEKLRSGNKLRVTSQSPDVTELTDSSQLRFRIVPKLGGTFFTSHYVSRIRIFFEDGDFHDAQLELLGSEGVVTLDIIHSEWARLHEKDGVPCRMLAQIAGRNKGGQFLVRRPDRGGVTIEVTSRSDDTREMLQVELLDMRDGTWTALAEVDATKSGEWRTLSVYTALFDLSELNIEAIADKARQLARPDAEILSVKVVANGAETISVLEREPFEIHVHVRFNRKLEMADVGIKLTRMDGVYVFWQSSGQVGGNLIRPEGEKLVRFRFDPNVIGAGEYYANTHVTNGWMYPKNYPYSEVFARLVNAASFRIVPQSKGLDLGVVNLLAPVAIETLHKQPIVIGREEA